MSLYDLYQLFLHTPIWQLIAWTVGAPIGLLLLFALILVDESATIARATRRSQARSRSPQG